MTVQDTADSRERRALKLLAAAVAGYWPNVDANATRVQTMISFLQDLGY
jgi:hypothetical protein